MISVRCKVLFVVFFLSVFHIFLDSSMATERWKKVLGPFQKNWRSSPLQMVGPQSPQALHTLRWQNELNLAVYEARAVALESHTAMKDFASEVFSIPGFGLIYGRSRLERETISGGILLKAHHFIWCELEAIILNPRSLRNHYLMGVSYVPLQSIFWSRHVGFGLTFGAANFDGSVGESSKWAPYVGTFLSYRITHQLDLFINTKASEALGLFGLVSLAAKI